MAVAEFLSGSDVFVNLPTGYGKLLIYHMAPLVSGDLTFKAAQPFIFPSPPPPPLLLLSA